MDFSLFPSLRHLVTGLSWVWLGDAGRDQEVGEKDDVKEVDEESMVKRPDEEEMKEAKDEEKLAPPLEGAQKLQLEAREVEAEIEINVVEHSVVEDVEGDSLLDITELILENVLDDVWSSHRSCVEDFASPEELPKNNDTIADIWMEMNRRAEEELDKERDKLVEDLLVDLEDDFEVILAREQSFEVVEDGNANDNKVENLEIIEIDETLEEEVQNEADVHLECRVAGQECGRSEEVASWGRRHLDIFRLPKLSGLKNGRLPVKVNIQNESVETIEDLETMSGERKTNKMKTIAKSAILVKAGARKRKVQETLGQLFSSNGNEIEEYANKRKKIEVNKQTKTETKKQTKRVMWTRSATKVSIGGTEETVKTFTCSLL